MAFKKYLPEIAFFVKNIQVAAYPLWKNGQV